MRNDGHRDSTAGLVGGSATAGGTSSSGSSGSSNVVGVHYKVGKKIGEGSFGVIFEGTNLLNNQTVAIKFEPRKSDAPQLRDEYRSYKILSGCPGIPQVYYFGQEGLHNILVIDLLGPCLEDLFEMCGRKFSVKTCVMVAKQMLTRVQTIHEKNLIYRDIKPDNFLIGRPGTKGENMIFVVDFGMAKQYRDPKTKQHIPYRERKSLSGTARYMSINTHLGREQSRRDDLESLGHVFFYFLRGGLPWQGLKAATNKQKYEKIGEKKQTTPIPELCENYPQEFAIYLNYVRKLGFEETPDYDFMRDLFTKALEGTGEVEDGIYDWMLLNNGKGWQANSLPPPPESRQHRSRGEREREKDRADRLRAAGTNNGALLPSAPTKVRKSATAINTAQANPSNQAIIGVSAPSPAPGSRRQSAQQGGSHPFAAGLGTQQASESRDQPYSRQNGEYDPSGVTLQSGAIMPPTNNGRSGLQTPISDQPQSRSANPQQQMHVGNSEYQQRQLEGDNGEYAEPRRGGNKLLNFLMCRCG
ncbi:Palmitoylated plasma membrane-bound casein kinase [Naganishia albida]|nr:Palmitoylated plasma membrane-bound casein kinase [Naganishia albida]